MSNYKLALCIGDFDTKNLDKETARKIIDKIKKFLANIIYEKSHFDKLTLFIYDGEGSDLLIKKAVSEYLHDELDLSNKIDVEYKFNPKKYDKEETYINFAKEANAIIFFTNRSIVNNQMLIHELTTKNSESCKLVPIGHLF